MKNTYFLMSLIPIEQDMGVSNVVGLLDVFEANNPSVAKKILNSPLYAEYVFLPYTNNQSVDDYLIEHDYCKVYSSKDLVPIGIATRKNVMNVVDDIVILYTTCQNPFITTFLN